MERVRNKVREPKAGKFWCWSCDRSMVAEREKCPVCGQRHGRKRDKKQSQVRIGEEDAG